MHRDERLDVPALYPLLACVAGLILGPALVNPLAAAAGAACLVPLFLGIRRRRAALIAILLFAGLVVSISREHRLRAEREAVCSLGSERFSQVEAPIRRDWRRRTPEESVLVVDRFSVITAEGRIDIRQPLVVNLTGDPPPTATHALLVAEGFLRPGRGDSFRLSLKSPRLMEYRGTLPWWSVSGFNRRLNDALSAYAEEHPRHARSVFLAQALALGRSDQLPDDLRESYRRGGIYHLLVFSGMQIALAAALLAAIFRAAHAPRGADWTLLILSILAPPFAGNEPSVTRASWMIGLYSFSRLIGRPTRADNLLFVSALIRLLARPGELTDASFALTYAAAGGLILIGNAFAGEFRSRPARALAFGAGAELATAPLTLYYFHQFVAAGSVVTLAASPLIAAMLGLSALSALAAWLLPGAAGTLLGQIAHLDRLCGWMSALVGEQLGLSGMAAAPPPGLIGFSFAVPLIMLPLLKRRGRAAAALFLLLPVGATVWTTLSSSPSMTTVEFLDVGQGDAILLRTPSGVMLVDGGGRKDDTRWGRMRFVPMLLDRGIRTVDVAVLTHPDHDHCAGLIAAVEHLRVGELWVSSAHVDLPCGRELVETAERRRTTMLMADRLDRVSRAGMSFEVITPRLRFKRSPSNNGSVVLRATIGRRRVLLSGDIEKEAERLYAEEEAALLSADVLKVPHHGSLNSSTPMLLAAVRPKIAVVSSGRRNRFGHPAPEVVDRLRHAAVVTARTDLSGSVLLRFDGGRIEVRRQFDTPPGGL